MRSRNNCIFIKVKCNSLCAGYTIQYQNRILLDSNPKSIINLMMLLFLPTTWFLYAPKNADRLPVVECSPQTLHIGNASIRN